MKTITFTAAGMVTCLANMLECYDVEAEGAEIALGMEAPYLFLHEDGQYYAGSRLYRPKWLNLYLLPRGFRMEEICLPRDSIPAFLRPLRTAILPLHIDKAGSHPVVFTGYASGRYSFVNIKQADAPEPATFSLTTAALKRRLAENTTVFTLENCPPQRVDFIPYLLTSLRNLDRYWTEFLRIHPQTVSRAELGALRTPFLRALMQDMQPMAALIGDFTLAEELRHLNHDYRHIFTHNSPDTVPLYEKLPKSSVKKCILWLKEDIIDRLYELGATDELVEEYSQIRK